MQTATRAFASVPLDVTLAKGAGDVLQAGFKALCIGTNGKPPRRSGTIQASRTLHMLTGRCTR
jgi:hypothetical protein